MTVLSPQLSGAAACSVPPSYDYTGPVAVRYPRGHRGPALPGGHLRSARLCPAAGRTQFTLAGYGNLIGELLEAAELLEAEGISCEVVKFNQLIPLNAEHVLASAEKPTTWRWWRK